MTYCVGGTVLVTGSITCTAKISDFLGTPFFLPWGSSITAIVQAYNNYGDSYTSNPGNGAIIVTYPGSPTAIVDNILLRTSTSLTISWTPPSSNGGATILSYELAYDQSIGNYIVLGSDITTTTYQVKGLKFGLTYTFKVRALNSLGYGDFSATKTLLCATIPA